MKKAFGFLLTFLCLPILWWIGDNIWTEMRVAQAHEEKISEAMRLPTIQAQLPEPVLTDQHRSLVSAAQDAAQSKLRRC